MCTIIRRGIVYKDELYVGGSFQSINYVPLWGFAKLTDSLWTRVGTGIPGNGVVSALTIYNDKLIIGGADIGQYYNNILAWNGQSYEVIPVVMDYVNGLCVDTLNNFLYASTSYVFRWDGYTWEWLDSISHLYGQCCYYNKEVYVAGDMIQTPNASFKRICRYTGKQWEKCGNGVDGGIEDFYVYDDTLYVAGSFAQNDNTEIKDIGMWYYSEDSLGCDWLQSRMYFSPEVVYLSDSGTVHFDNNNRYAQNWLWDFGDGATDTIRQPVHEYTTQGDYNITLYVTEDGCTDTVTKLIQVINFAGTEEAEKDQIFLGQNQPNPHNGTTVIPYSVRTHDHASQQAYLQITTTSGEIIDEYVLNPQEYLITIDMKGYAAGVYFYSLVVDGKVVETKKMVVK
ncbi:MAG: T9SS type A sorting domain-containing protein [Bacteroidetes bacterium]|nr:T9SS type A sorting domain-containing protein [Bacteroidota bacterium]MBU1720202.1 T9SS type A sorting domain-containing protein [Bacteroidota bacterium]